MIRFGGLSMGTRLAIGLSIALTMGCSERSASVSGVVTLDSKPITIGDGQRGMVVFRPVAGGATCTSLITDDGAYRVATGSSTGVVPGDYMVSVRVIELVPAAEGQGAEGRPITPAVYSDPLTSGLVYSVKSGENRIEIPLDSSAGPAVLPQPVPETEEGEGSTEADADEAPVEGEAIPSEEEETSAGGESPQDEQETAAEESSPADKVEATDAQQ